MDSKTILTGKTASILRGVVLFTVFSLVFAAAAGAEALTFSGKIVLTDSEARTLAIAPFDRGVTGNIFVVNEKVSIRMDGKRLSFGDIVVGDFVSVAYHKETDGINVIDAIAVTAKPSEAQAYVIVRNPWKQPLSME